MEVHTHIKCAKFATLPSHTVCSLQGAKGPSMIAFILHNRAQTHTPGRQMEHTHTQFTRNTDRVAQGDSYRSTAWKRRKTPADWQSSSRRQWFHSVLLRASAPVMGCSCSQLPGCSDLASCPAYNRLTQGPSSPQWSFVGAGGVPDRGPGHELHLRQLHHPCPCHAQLPPGLPPWLLLLLLLLHPRGPPASPPAMASCCR